MSLRPFDFGRPPRSPRATSTAECRSSHCAPRSSWCRSLHCPSMLLDQSEVDDFGDVVGSCPRSQTMMFAGLMSRWMSPMSCASFERAGRPASRCEWCARHRSGPPSSTRSSKIDPVEVLHRVVEDALRGSAKIVNRDGIRMAEHAGQLHLALEADQRWLAGLVGRQQLDRGRSPAASRGERWKTMPIPPSPIFSSSVY